MSEAPAVFQMLACRKTRMFYALMMFGVLCLVTAGCRPADVRAPVGWWRSSQYPSAPPSPESFLEIRSNGEYSYSTLPGHGRWAMRGDVLVLNPYPGAKREELKVESHPPMLRNTITDGVDFLPAAGHRAAP